MDESTATESYQAETSPEASVEASESPQIESNGQSDDSLNRRMEILSRRERELMGRETSYRTEMKRTQEMERQLLDYKNKLRELDELDQDPITVLGRRGWDVHRLAEKFQNQHEPIAGEEKKTLYSKLNEMDAYIKSMESKIKEKDEMQLESQRGQVKNRLYSDMKRESEMNPDKYELIHNENAYDHVYEVLEAFYEKSKAEGNPRNMHISEAMDLVENYLDAELRKKLKYKKFQNQAKEEYPEETTYQDVYRPSTLTNNLSQTIPPQSNRPLTREESLRRAASLIQFND